MGSFLHSHFDGSASDTATKQPVQRTGMA